MPTTCKFPGCTKNAKYGYSKEDKKKFCKPHSKDGMINISSSLCECGKRAIFGIPGGKKTHCKTHSSSEMIDLMTTRCKFKGCNKHPIFGFPNGKKSHCGEHRLDGMIDVKHIKCQQDGCDTTASFGLPNCKKRTHCCNHKTDDMIQIAYNICMSPECTKQAQNSNYNGFCYTCFMEQNPNSVFARNYKIKEKEVMRVLSERYGDFSYDRTISGTRYRPDCYREEDKCHLIVEIDEFQHKHQSYKDSDDEDRFSNIFFSLGSDKPLRIIRFNTDSYDNIRSPWDNTKGKTTKIRNRSEWNRRIDILIETIDGKFSMNEEQSIHTTYLFYNSSS